MSTKEKAYKQAIIVKKCVCKYKKTEKDESKIICNITLKNIDNKYLLEDKVKLSIYTIMHKFENLNIDITTLQNTMQILPHIPNIDNNHIIQLITTEEEIDICSMIELISIGCTILHYKEKDKKVDVKKLLSKAKCINLEKINDNIIKSLESDIYVISMGDSYKYFIDIIKSLCLDSICQINFEAMKNILSKKTKEEDKVVLENINNKLHKYLNVIIKVNIEYADIISEDLLD